MLRSALERFGFLVDRSRERLRPDAHTGSLVVSTSVITRGGPSIGFPWEGVGLFLRVLLLRKAIGNPRIVHVIGDYLAELGEPSRHTSDGEIRTQAKLHADVALRTAKKFGMEILPVSARDLSTTLEWQFSLDTVMTRRPYGPCDQPEMLADLRKQGLTWEQAMAQVLKATSGASTPEGDLGLYGRLWEATFLTLIRTHQMSIKVGWSEGGQAARTSCMHRFDSDLLLHHPETRNLSCVYVPGGRTTNLLDHRSTVPYTVSQAEASTRIFLTQIGEARNVQLCWDDLLRQECLVGSKYGNQRRMARATMRDLHQPLDLATELGWTPRRTTVPEQIVELLGYLDLL